MRPARRLLTLFAIFLFFQGFAQPLRTPRFKVLAFYSYTVEKAHIDFSDAAIKFFKELTVGNMGMVHTCLKIPRNKK